MISSCNQHKTIVNQILYMHFFSFEDSSNALFCLMVSYNSHRLSSFSFPVIASLLSGTTKYPRINLYISAPNMELMIFFKESWLLVLIERNVV